MKKAVYLFLFFFISIQSFAQFTITGQIKPTNTNYSTMLLYKTEGAFQYYKASTSIDSAGLFGFQLPEDFPTGSYRLVYNAQLNEYVNIIFNNEDIRFVFNPDDLINSIYFMNSDENGIFFDYIRLINEQYLILDSIQKEFYINNKSIELVDDYHKQFDKINAYQTFFEEQSYGKIVNNIIRSFKKINNPKPFLTKDEYYSHLKSTYLNSIEFSNKHLQNSSFILDRLNEYIFDLNEAIANRNDTLLDTKMLDIAFDNLNASKFKNEIIYSITNNTYDPYSSNYDFLLDYIYNNYYKKLPIESKNLNLDTLIINKLKVIEGKKAPNIKLLKESLYDLKSDSTFVIFWSTTCSHCLKEIPKIYKLLNNRKNLEVIIIGLEESYSDWENVIKAFPNWKHIRANGKWKHPIAKDFNVKTTPAYFLLDSNKIIINKPDELIDVIEIFD